MDDDLNFFGGGIKYIDVSVLQRNNKKCWTVISGLEYKESEKKVLLQKLKKMLSCNGNIDENGNVKVTGNHKTEITEILVNQLEIERIRIR